MRRLLSTLALLFLLAPLIAGQTITCPAGITVIPLGAGTRGTCVAAPPPVNVAPTIGSFNASASVTNPIPLGQRVTFSWSGITGTPTPALSLVGPQAPGPVTTSPVMVQPAAVGDHLYTFRASNGVMPDATRTWTVRVTPVTPPVTPIWGDVDPAILGDFTAAEHDAWTVDGGDGFRYRVWHPQCPVIVGGVLKCYAHEHSDDPATQTDAWVRANWDGRMGYAARRMTSPAEPDGHREAHEGYKSHVTNIGDVNGEGRVNKTATTSMPHFGTAAPPRFTIPMHSVSLAERQGAYQIQFHVMADTGTTHAVCDPRAQAPTKDAIMLGSPCKIPSSYEIWSMKVKLRKGGLVVLDQLITPARFDPLSVFNPANPLELVRPWDPRVALIKQFPSDDWSGFRGCSGESYSILGRVETMGATSDVYWTDAMGNEVASTDPKALRQIVPPNLTGVPPLSSNIEQFKLRVNWCDGTEQWATENGWRPRPGIAGKVSKAKLGLKN